ncbi:tetratricopeptide repeat protein [Aquirhabdus parva]|uniref:Uncharacterized protein n=1 Tax=Aquirhabdus parva TaxID=2283318 RepID=A0A345P7Z2_9GAMM|nr:tetratricopeptide repeat protein [Aquirhabdus parva]AXI03401.1 hypothetical protein HYN46_11455 [Aquirhabdus parva]
MSEFSEKVGGLIEAKQWNAALDEIQIALDQNASSAEHWVMQSRVFLEMKRLSYALSSVQHALSLSPNFAPAHYQMAYVLRAQGQVADAIVSYARAFNLHPVLGDSLGWCHAMVLIFAQYQFAMPIAEFWSRQRPDEAGAWFLLGSCRLALRLDATEALLKAWALDPSILDLPNNLGGAYLMKGDLVQAQHWLNLALERQADDENTLSNLALLDKLKKKQWAGQEN